MKTKIFLPVFVLIGLKIFSQQLTNAPEGKNDPNLRLSRLIDGDNNNFYAYRVRTKGKGTSYYIEKFDKATMKPLWSKEVLLAEDRYTKVEDVQLAGGMVYIFVRQYIKKENKMTFNYFSVTPEGIVSPKMQEILYVNSDHYEYCDYEVFKNPSKTKILVKACWRTKEKDKFHTRFMLLDAAGLKKISDRSLDICLLRDHTRFEMVGAFSAGEGELTGLMLDDNDNIIYAYNYLTQGSTGADDLHFKLAIYLLKPGDNIPYRDETTFGSDYFAGDVLIRNTGDLITIAGFYHDVAPHKGKELVKAGVFELSFDVSDHKIKLKAVKPFDDALLEELNMHAKEVQWFRFKADELLIANGDYYIVGEQYQFKAQEDFNPDTHTTTYFWDYHYRDVLVAKLNTKGDFEWIENVPVRKYVSVLFSLLNKQYIAYATGKSVYIMYDEDPKNLKTLAKKKYDQADLAEVTEEVATTNFVCNTISSSDGKQEHKVLFSNDDYCFEPIVFNKINFMPSPETPLFMPTSDKSEIIFYTHTKGKDHFIKAKLE